VATGAGGIPELISDGVNGFIVPVNDHVSFAERLCMLIERSDLRKQMGERSGPVLEENSIARTVEKTMEVYEKLVKDGDNERFQDA